MSMNLYCNKIEVWQTSTIDTYIIYGNNAGGEKGILYRYLCWVKQWLPTELVTVPFENKKAKASIITCKTGITSVPTEYILKAGGALMGPLQGKLHKVDHDSTLETIVDTLNHIKEVQEACNNDEAYFTIV